jgi:hypothetical protein
MSEDTARLIRVIEMLMRHATFAEDCIELDGNLDGEEWLDMAKGAIEEAKGVTA